MAAGFALAENSVVVGTAGLETAIRAEFIRASKPR
jgi:hypothetical protein